MAINVSVQHGGGFLPGIMYSMYGHTYSKSSMDQPGKVASPARSQLNNRENEYFPVHVVASRLRILLLTQCYYHRGARLNVMKRFCLAWQPTMFPPKRFDGMLRRFRYVQPEKTTLNGGQSRSWSAEQGKESKIKSLAAYPPRPPHCSFGEK